MSNLNKEGTATKVISAGYLHYKDTDGRMKEIDRRIVSSRFGVTRGLYHAHFNKDVQEEWPFTMRLRDDTSLRVRWILFFF